MAYVLVFVALCVDSLSHIHTKQTDRMLSQIFRVAVRMCCAIMMFRLRFARSGAVSTPCNESGHMYAHGGVEQPVIMTLTVHVCTCAASSYDVVNVEVVTVTHDENITMTLLPCACRTSTKKREEKW